MGLPSFSMLAYGEKGPCSGRKTGISNYMDYNFHLMSLPHGRTYLMNTSRDVVIRSSPGKTSRFYAKERGGKEFELHHLSDLLHDTLKAAKKITRVEYSLF